MNATPVLEETTSSQAPSPSPSPAATWIAAARQQFDGFTVQQPDPSLQRELHPGWLLPILLHLDEALWGRWDYWRRCCEGEGVLPDDPIPRLPLLDFPHPATRRMLEASLNCMPRHGCWQSWGGGEYFRFLLQWLLFGLGHKGQAELPPEPSGCEGASMRLYQVFCLDALLLWPHDYWGDLLAHSAYGKGQGFYPTPHTVCEAMTRMLMEGKGKDARLETVCDPCVGTGRFLLHASNHSLRLYGLDIDSLLCRAALVNGYLYAPWLVRPIPWLEPALAQLEQAAPSGQNEVEESATRLSDRIVATASPHAQSRLAATEQDSGGQRAVAPLLKRRRKPSVDPSQGRLFELSDDEDWCSPLAILGPCL